MKAKHQQLVLVDKQDTISKIIETEVGMSDNFVSPERIIQIGAFRNESRAIALRDKLSQSLEKPAVIVNEGGYYKVQVTGLKNLTELKQTLSALGNLGLSDVWIPGLKKQDTIPQPAVEKPAIVLPDTAAKKIEKKPEEKVKVPVVEEKPVPQEPPISLHVAAYHKRMQAVRAQRKIMSKLHLQVEVVQQWDTYHVLVTGFYTREETFKYYPELAGIGFPNITLIQKK